MPEQAVGPFDSAQGGELVESKRSQNRRGRRPTPPLIHHSTPTLGEAEARALARVVASGYLSRGPEVERLEGVMAERLGRRGAVATGSGTQALELALRVLGVGSGAEVIVPSYTCTAVLDAVVSVGATAVLADVSRDTLNLTAETVLPRLSSRTGAIVVPHMCGLPAPIDEICRLGVPVVEDCAQCLGTTWRGRPVGGWGVASILSFYATKVLTTGYGGMLLADEEALLKEARDLIDYDEREEYRQRLHPCFSELQAVLGLTQLERLEGFVERRRAIAARYTEALGGLAVAVPQGEGHMYFRYVLRCEGPSEGLIGWLAQRGIEAKRPVYRPLHQYLGLPEEEFPESRWLHEHVVSLPIYPSLSDRQAERVIEGVTSFVHR